LNLLLCYLFYASVYHQDKKILLYQFHAKGSPFVCLSSMDFVNPLYDPLLLTISGEKEDSIF
jgi:hypothetical protein